MGSGSKRLLDTKRLSSSISVSDGDLLFITERSLFGGGRSSSRGAAEGQPEACSRLYNFLLLNKLYLPRNLFLFSSSLFSYLCTRRPRVCSGLSLCSVQYLRTGALPSPAQYLHRRSTYRGTTAQRTVGHRRFGAADVDSELVALLAEILHLRRQIYIRGGLVE